MASPAKAINGQKLLEIIARTMPRTARPIAMLHKTTRTHAADAEAAAERLFVMLRSYEQHARCDIDPQVAPRTSPSSNG